MLTHLHAEAYDRLGERLEQAWWTHLGHFREPHSTVQRQIDCEIWLALAHGRRVEPLDGITRCLLPGDTLLIGTGFSLCDTEFQKTTAPETRIGR
jgi:hypothetical protein